MTAQVPRGMPVIAARRLKAADYFAMPPTKTRYELLDGRLIKMPSPTADHQDVAGAVMEALSSIARIKGGEVLFALDVELDENNVVQPDVLYVAPGSRADIREHVYGPPDLVVEVLLPSNKAYDEGEKLPTYACHGVREAWLVDLEMHTVTVHVANSGRLVRSQTVPFGQAVPSTLIEAGDAGLGALAAERAGILGPVTAQVPRGMPVIAARRLKAADYFAMPPTKTRYELLDGRLIQMPSPTSDHQEAAGEVFSVLRLIARSTGGKAFFAPLDVELSEDNVVQPDVLYIAPGSRADVREHIYGPPDLVVEVLSPSTKGYDAREKLPVYALFGVREAWLVDPATRTVTVHVAEDGRFVRSQTVPFGEPVPSTLVEAGDAGLGALAR